MADLGSKTEQVQGDKFVLREGNDTWVLKTIAALRLSHPKTTDSTPTGPTLSFGTGEHVLEATVIASVPDITRMLAYNKRSPSGALPSHTWSLIATPLNGGNTVTVSFTGQMGTCQMVHQSGSKLEFIIHIDITDDDPAVS